MALAVSVVLSSAMRTHFPQIPSNADRGRIPETDKEATRVEHGEVKVVAVNDPFIEAHYAVSFTSGKTNSCWRVRQMDSPADPAFLASRPTCSSTTRNMANSRAQSK